MLILQADHTINPRQAWPVAAAMTDHIQNNPFGRSTDSYRDDWPAVQIGGTARAPADPLHHSP